jgi:cytochrome c-type biogenesis protein CcmH
MMKALFATLVLLFAAAPAAAADVSVLPDIEDEVMCPVCGTTLETSNGPQADRERALIRRLDEQGLSKEEIKDELVAEYGEDVLAEPETSGFDLTAWALPAIGIALAIGGLALAAVRLRRREPEPDEPALDPAELKRLDEDMSRHEA